MWRCTHEQPAGISHGQRGCNNGQRRHSVRQEVQAHRVNVRRMRARDATATRVVRWKSATSRKAGLGPAGAAAFRKTPDVLCCRLTRAEDEEAKEVQNEPGDTKLEEERGGLYKGWLKKPPDGTRDDEEADEDEEQCV